jgi:hypothetical protein
MSFQQAAGPTGAATQKHHHHNQRHSQNQHHQHHHKHHRQQQQDIETRRSSQSEEDVEGGEEGPTSMAVLTQIIGLDNVCVTLFLSPPFFCTGIQISWFGMRLCSLLTINDLAPLHSQTTASASTVTVGSAQGAEEFHEAEKPDANEIILYARQLGMDLARDSDLLWIAEQALQVGCGWWLQ